MKVSVTHNLDSTSLGNIIECMVLSGMGPDGTSAYSINEYKILPDNMVEIDVDWIEGKFVSKEEVYEYIREELEEYE